MESLRSNVSASRPDPSPVFSSMPPLVKKLNCDFLTLTTPRLLNGSAATVNPSTLLISIKVSLKILGIDARSALRTAAVVGDVPIIAGFGVIVKSAV